MSIDYGTVGGELTGFKQATRSLDLIQASVVEHSPLTRYAVPNSGPFDPSHGFS